MGEGLLFYEKEKLFQAYLIDIWNSIYYPPIYKLLLHQLQELLKICHYRFLLIYIFSQNQFV